MAFPARWGLKRPEPGMLLNSHGDEELGGVMLPSSLKTGQGQASMASFTSDHVGNGLSYGLSALPIGASMKL